MWYKNYYTWFLTWGFLAGAMVAPVGLRYVLTGKTTRRKVTEGFMFHSKRDKRFSPNGDSNIYTGLDYIK